MFSRVFQEPLLGRHFFFFSFVLSVLTFRRRLNRLWFLHPSGNAAATFPLFLLFLLCSGVENESFPPGSVYRRRRLFDASFSSSLFVHVVVVSSSSLPVSSSDCITVSPPLLFPALPFFLPSSDGSLARITFRTTTTTSIVLAHVGRRRGAGDVQS